MLFVHSWQTKKQQRVKNDNGRRQPPYVRSFLIILVKDTLFLGWVKAYQKTKEYGRLPSMLALVIFLSFMIKFNITLYLIYGQLIEVL